MKTKVSGYSKTYDNSKSAKRCETCEHNEQTDLCNGKMVMKDLQVPSDVVTGLKVISPNFGVCDYWDKC